MNEDRVVTGSHVDGTLAQFGSGETEHGTLQSKGNCFSLCEDREAQTCGFFEAAYTHVVFNPGKLQTDFCGSDGHDMSCQNSKLSMLRAQGFRDDDKRFASQTGRVCKNPDK